MTSSMGAISGPYAEPQPLSSRDQLGAALQPTVMAALRAALPEMARGAFREASPSLAAPDRRERTIVVEDSAGRRHDVIVDVQLHSHRPPGWSTAARYNVGDAIEVSADGERASFHSPREGWEVIEVLGTVEDPRPGYRLRHLGRTEQGVYSRALGDGREVVVPPDVESRASRVQGGFA